MFADLPSSSLAEIALMMQLREVTLTPTLTLTPSQAVTPTRTLTLTRALTPTRTLTLTRAPRQVPPGHFFFRHGEQSRALYFVLRGAVSLSNPDPNPSPNPSSNPTPNPTPKTLAPTLAPNP